jgi:hypothetical protein
MENLIQMENPILQYHVAVMSDAGRDLASLQIVRGDQTVNIFVLVTLGDDIKREVDKTCCF